MSDTLATYFGDLLRREEVDVGVISERAAKGKTE
jgi:hypothetical protein